MLTPEWAGGTGAAGVLAGGTVPFDCEELDLLDFEGVDSSFSLSLFSDLLLVRALPIVSGITDDRADFFDDFLSLLPFELIDVVSSLSFLDGAVCVTRSTLTTSRSSNPKGS